MVFIGLKLNFHPETAGVTPADLHDQDGAGVYVWIRLCFTCPQTWLKTLYCTLTPWLFSVLCLLYTTTGWVLWLLKEWQAAAVNLKPKHVNQCSHLLTTGSYLNSQSGDSTRPAPDGVDGCVVASSTAPAVGERSPRSKAVVCVPSGTSVDSLSRTVRQEATCSHSLDDPQPLQQVHPPTCWICRGIQIKKWHPADVAEML